MKKSLMVIALVGIMAIGATSAMAWGHGRGMGGGMGYNGYGCCMMAAGPGAGIGQGTEQITADGAKAKVQEFVNQYYKGYKVGDATAETGPRGFTMYVVKATDASGNSFVFHVNPGGFIRGPILESQYNDMLQYRQNIWNNAPMAPVN